MLQSEKLERQIADLFLQPLQFIQQDALGHMRKTLEYWGLAVTVDQPVKGAGFQLRSASASIRSDTFQSLLILSIEFHRAIFSTQITVDPTTTKSPPGLAVAVGSA